MKKFPTNCFIRHLILFVISKTAFKKINLHSHKVSPGLGLGVGYGGVEMVWHLGPAHGVLGVLRGPAVDGDVAVVELLRAVVLAAGAGAGLVLGAAGRLPRDVGALRGCGREGGGVHPRHRRVLVPGVGRRRRRRVSRADLAPDFRLMMLLAAPRPVAARYVRHGVTQFLPETALAPPGHGAGAQQSPQLGVHGLEGVAAQHAHQLVAVSRAQGGLERCPELRPRPFVADERRRHHEDDAARRVRCAHHGVGEVGGAAVQCQVSAKGTSG
jgi:hypothetical protein